MEQQIKSGPGWRIGWDPTAERFLGLVGTDDWAIELTEAELNDFCRLTLQLADTMTQMAEELMEEETISCEAESSLLWLEVTGFPHDYALRLILLTERRGECRWPADAVPGLVQAIQLFRVF